MEHLVEGPPDADEIKRRLVRIESLRNQDAAATELEFQLLAAAVHGDPIRHPKQGYDALLDYAKKSGFPLPAGGPDISHPEHKDNTPDLPKDPAPPKPRWQPPKTRRWCWECDRCWCIRMYSVPSRAKCKMPSKETGELAFCRAMEID